MPVTILPKSMSDALCGHVNDDMEHDLSLASDTGTSTYSDRMIELRK